MSNEKAETISVAVSVGIAALVQLIQLTFELARMWGLSQEELMDLIETESDVFNLNTPDKLPDPVTVSPSEEK